jgi:LacI family transcriptional regulator
MRDVARKADVSTMTVSRVLNNRGGISEATRQRVLTAIEELGYRPSKVARALVTRRTDTVGLILGDITNPFFPEVARGVLDTAQANGYNIFLCNADGDAQQELRMLHSLADHAVDGIIIFPAYEGENEFKAFAKAHPPLVVVNRFFEHPGIGLVMMDVYRGAKLAIDYLVSKGHTAIGMLAGLSSLGRLQRVRGFRDALMAHGLPVVDEWILRGPPVLERGYESTRQLLTQHPQVTAIFAYNDLLALGASQACHKLGRRVPEDCAIVGFDDIPLAALVTPSLTTVRVDKYELGRQAMIRLLEMLSDPEGTFPPIWLDVELVSRQSA